MSRVTAPVTKFTHAIRGISTSAQAARPSILLDSHSQHANYLPRNLRDLKQECSRRNLDTHGNKSELVERLTANDHTRSHSTTAGHRPTTSTTNQTYRIRPLMQGFRTSAPKAAAHDSSTIDFMFFPATPEPPPVNPFAKLRVPLLPDNYNPDRSPESAHAIESPDEAIPRPEIVIVAAHPEHVAPAAMTEVVDNAGLDVDITHLTKAFSSTDDEVKEPGMLEELWTGIVDDIFGEKQKVKT